MEYFINHLPYIIVAAVGIAAIAGIWAFLTVRSDEPLRGEEEDTGRPEVCEGCALSGICKAGGPENCDEPDRR